MRAGDLRHTVNVMRPTEATGSLGETQGEPKLICKNWPCSIAVMSGRELELARQNFAAANLKVEGYGDPRNPFKATDYLTGGSIGGRVLNVGFVNDLKQNGLELSLVCGEAT